MSAPECDADVVGEVSGGEVGAGGLGGEPDAVATVDRDGC